MVTEGTYFGTELKFLVSITASGFSMETDDFQIEVSCGSKKKTFLKEDLIIDDNDNYYLPINTEEFRRGDLYATTYVYVPDADFPDGLRTEVDKQKLITIKAL